MDSPNAQSSSYFIQCATRSPLTLYRTGLQYLPLIQRDTHTLDSRKKLPLTGLSSRNYNILICFIVHFVNCIFDSINDHINIGWTYIAYISTITKSITDPKTQEYCGSHSRRCNRWHCCSGLRHIPHRMYQSSPLFLPSLENHFARHQIRV